jgi:hypothetical protein
MSNEIKTFTVETKGGNTLQFFYNPQNDLVTVDLIAKNEKGGNEILRKTLDETQLLKHTTKREYHCDTCEKPISRYQYYKGKGLCFACVDAIQ